MPILLKTSKQSSGRAPTISDNPTVDWQHPVNEGLYSWWPMVNGIWHDLTGTFPKRYPMEQMGAGAKITFDGNVYWNSSQAAYSFNSVNPKGYRPDVAFDATGPFTFMYAYKSAGTGSSMYPFGFNWEGGDSIKIFTQYHTRPVIRTAASYSSGTLIDINADNFGITNYGANDRIVNVLGHVDGGASGSASGMVYKDHSAGKSHTSIRRPDNATNNIEYAQFDGGGPTATRNPRAHLGMRLWQGELNESAIDTLLNDRWAGMWWKTKTIFLPATTSPSTSTFFLKTNAKTGAVNTPVPDWNSPLLEHCLSIAVVIGDRPARFDKYQTTPTFLDVINTSGGITREVSPRAARLGYRTNGTTTDNVSLGSITSNDVWSFYGQTEVSVISSIEWDNLPGSILPRIVDKSSSTAVNNGWTLFFWDTTPKSARFAMNDGTLRVLTANSGDWVSPNIRVVGASLSGIPVSGTATASMQIYANGARTGSTSGTLSPFPATTTNAAVGNSPAGSRSADGHTNYVAIFDKALTDAEHLAWAQDEFAWIDKSSTRSQIYIPATTPPPSTSAPVYLYHHRHRNRAA